MITPVVLPQSGEFPTNIMIHPWDHLSALTNRIPIYKSSYKDESKWLKMGNASAGMDEEGPQLMKWRCQPNLRIPSWNPIFATWLDSPGWAGAPRILHSSVNPGPLKKYRWKQSISLDLVISETLAWRYPKKCFVSPTIRVWFDEYLNLHPRYSSAFLINTNRTDWQRPRWRAKFSRPHWTSITSCTEQGVF